MVISANVTDIGSGVRNVTLLYSVDAGKTWNEIPMLLNADRYEASIPSQSEEIRVEYYIETYDKVGNIAMSNTLSYSISRSMIGPTSIIIVAIILATTILLIERKKA